MNCLCLNFTLFRYLFILSVDLFHWENVNYTVLIRALQSLVRNLCERVWESYAVQLHDIRSVDVFSAIWCSRVQFRKTNLLRFPFECKHGPSLLYDIAMWFQYKFVERTWALRSIQLFRSSFFLATVFLYRKLLKSYLMRKALVRNRFP